MPTLNSQGMLMFFRQFAFNPNQKMSLGTKISLAIWIIVGLGLLFAFTFTLFVIAVLAGIVILLLRLFGRRPASTISYQNSEVFIERSHFSKPLKKESDDIIDI